MAPLLLLAGAVDTEEPNSKAPTPWRHRAVLGASLVLSWVAATAHLARRASARRLRRWSRRPLLWIVGPPLAATLLLGGLLFHHVAFERGETPDLEPFLRFEPLTTGQVYDRKGELLIELAREYRTVVQHQELPPVVEGAILAAEDKNFYGHGGIDVSVIPRLVWKAALHTGAATWRQTDTWTPRIVFPQGGSTLTQQLVRGYFLRDLTSREDADDLVRDTLATRALAAVIGGSATNKLARKVEEIRLSLWLEREMEARFGSKRAAKEQILARYASFIYLGHGRYGFAAGAQYYFGRRLGELTAEDADAAAVLAGITKSPGAYAPSRENVERPTRRRNNILRLMAANGTITAASAERLQQKPLQVADRAAYKTDAPAAIDSVFAELKASGVAGVDVEALIAGRIRVHTTVDARVQRIVNAALEEGLRRYEERHPKAKGLVQGAIVVLRNSDGGVLAEAGGRQIFGDRRTSYSDFNRAVDSLRQPGSAIKPIVYLTGFSQGLIDLDSIVPDEPISVSTGLDLPPKWIDNYDGEFKGPIPVRQALAESRNTVAIWIAQNVGIAAVARTARDLGIVTPLQPYVTSALGATDLRLTELATAYRAIASGVVAAPHAIERVTDARGRVLMKPKPPRPLDTRKYPLAAIQAGLRGVIRMPSGTAHSLDGPAFPIPVMGKTGTTSNFRDALFVGSTWGPNGITIAVRVNFDDNREMGNKETGGRVALPIFREIMLRAYGEELLGPVPEFPEEIEQGIDEFLQGAAEEELELEEPVDAEAAALIALAPDTRLQALPIR